MKKSLIVLMLALLFYSCSKEKTDTKENEIKNNLNYGISELTITEPWVRVAAEGMNTAFFFKVTNPLEQNDTLISAESDIAEIIEIHETFVDENGLMGMRKIPFAVIPSNSTVEFKPRDLHVMAIRLKQDVKTGDTTLLKLTFNNAGEKKIFSAARDFVRPK